MADLAFGTSAYSRTRGNMPELPLINMFVETAPSAKLGVVLQSRPGLDANGSDGSGPVRAMFKKDGVLSGARFTVSGGSLYRNGVLMGAIGGTGPVSFAASPIELLINAGGAIYRTDGATLTTVAFPDGADVSRIAFLGGYFVALRKGTQQWYFSAVLDGTSWDGFDFASAENEPDQLLDVVVVDDVLVLLGSNSVEFWPKTGNPNIPFSPTEGKVFEKGVITTGCVITFDNTFAYIGADKIVYVAANVPSRVSDPGIEERLADSTSYALWGFSFEGHDFLCVRLTQGTWLFDAQTRQWCEFQSYGRPNWRAQCALPGPVFGDDTTGAIWVPGAHVDAGGVLERRFRAGFPMSGGTVSSNNLRLTINVGQSPNLAGQYANPVVEMRISRDGAQTWTNWRTRPLGAQGEYRTRVEWRRNGLFDDPGGIFEFRCTDPVPFRIAAVKMNEPSGGRAR